MQIDDLISLLEERLTECSRTNQVRPDKDDEFAQGIDCRVVNEIIFLDKLLHDYRMAKKEDKQVDRKPTTHAPSAPPAARIYRGWFKQSRLQPVVNQLNGERCIVEDRGGLTVRAWFSGGPIHSMEVERDSITSEQW
jgi:hypothetical protein